MIFNAFCINVGIIMVYSFIVLVYIFCTIWMHVGFFRSFQHGTDDCFTICKISKMTRYRETGNRLALYHSRTRCECEGQEPGYFHHFMAPGGCNNPWHHHGNQGKSHSWQQASVLNILSLFMHI